jgi:hypothetical protein
MLTLSDDRRAELVLFLPNYGCDVIGFAIFFLEMGLNPTTFLLSEDMREFTFLIVRVSPWS